MTNPPLPNLVIAGLGKAGTTSLFWYLSQHPDVCASGVKETRYFADAGRGTLPPLDGYAQHFRHCSDAPIRMEASPQYFHGGRPVIEAIRRTLDDVRIVLILRDPVTRLWSTYRFVKSRMGPIPETQSFDAYVEACERLHRERPPRTEDNRAYWTLHGSFYLEDLSLWHEAFGDRLRVLFFEHLSARPEGVVADVCRWLGIDLAPTASIDYSIQNRTVEVRSKVLQRAALVLNSERLLGGRRRLKAPLRRAYYAVNRRRAEETMSEDTHRRLGGLFADANRELATRLRGWGYQDLPAWLEPGGYQSSSA